MKTTIFVCGYNEKYFMQDIFDPDNYIEISEDYFNEIVVGYRNQYDMSYINGTTTCFIDKNTGLKYLRVRG